MSVAPDSVGVTLAWKTLKSLFTVSTGSTVHSAEHNDHPSHSSVHSVTAFQHTGVGSGSVNSHVPSSSSAFGLKLSAFSSVHPQG